MIVTVETEQDGRLYYPGEDMPDMGSLVGTTKAPLTSNNPDSAPRQYIGLYSDYDKLPHCVNLHYENLSTGSTAQLITTDEGLLHFIYEKTTDTWYKC